MRGSSIHHLTSIALVVAALLGFASMRSKTSVNNTNTTDSEHHVVAHDNNNNVDTTTITSRRLQKTTKNQPRIPHNLIFTYKTDILETKEPKMFFNNIKNTIKKYKQYWNESTATVYFLTDDKCRKILKKVEPQMVPYFDAEPLGVYKADICRISSLYYYGGYYFDIDIKVMQATTLDDDVVFSTVIQPERKDFFQAFMATAPGHPVLRRALKAMLYVYQGKLKVQRLLGPETLKWAFDAEEHKGKVYLYEEINLVDPGWYPRVRRQEGFGCCCNFGIHDPQKRRFHFFSRFAGDTRRCSASPI